MRSTSFVVAALLVGGCSFLQDWGSLRAGADGGGGGMDGGGIDGGGVDGGRDAGPDFDGGDCTLCAEQGCDPADTTVCHYDPDVECDVCDTGLLHEGDECNEDSQCESFLVCRLGICLLACTDRSSCGASSLGDLCGVNGDATVCVDHGCDPTGEECGGWVCALFTDVEDPGDPERGSVCVPPIGGIAMGLGSACDASVSCLDGMLCADDGTGMSLCRTACYPDEDPSGDCDGSELCAPIAGTSYDGRALGVCTANPAANTLECTDPSQCTAAGLGDHCAAGRCLQACSTDADCVAGRCVVVDGAGWCSRDCRPDGSCAGGYPCIDTDADGMSECYPACDSAGNCPSGYGCVDGLCVQPCADASECPVVVPQCVDVDSDPATLECAPSPRCGSVAECPAGYDLCEDQNGDGASECAVSP